MQEYTTPVRDSFRRGLRQRERAGTETEPALTECQYLYPTESGLRALPTITDPFSVSYYGFPFAQLLRTGYFTILAGSTVLRSVDESDWSTSLISVYDYLTDEMSYSFTAGDVWHMADAGKFLMLFNSDSIIFVSGAESMFGETAKYHIVTDRTVQTGCYHRGRILMGGFNASDFWSDQWQAVMDELTEDLQFDISTMLTMERNFVWWSSIGGGNALDIFYPERAVKGVIREAEDLSDPKFLDYWRRNDCGMAPMRYPGTVLRLLPMGEHIVAYGDEGFEVMRAVSGEAPTFAFTSVAAIGIAGRGAANGTDDFHIFVDPEGTVWRLDGEGLHRLGYEEFTANMLDGDIVISIDNREGDAYISDGEQTLIVNKYGAGYSPNHPTALILAGTTLTGVFDTDSSTETLVTTDWFDFRNNDLKTVTTVELGFEKGEDATVYVALDYSYTTDAEDYDTSDWIEINDNGWARPQITAKRFRLKIKVDDYTDFKLDYANIKWQQSGLRTIRGMHVDQANL